MTETKTVKTEVVNERRVGWTPKGYSNYSVKEAIIRDGEICSFPQVTACLVKADPDGCIEFIQAIRRAMDETAK
ncbi:hypothetical protein LCGC14_1698750 [marine sediment metagenome]|uniref:Uncharacterized protein n=1 Tax=marine sediment metagenome TaxID=412755 RepID=A0A0F9HJ69_9ZZZZ